MRTNLTNQLLWIHVSLPDLVDNMSLLLYVYQNSFLIKEINPRISVIFYNKPIDHVIGNHYKYYIKKN